ncbi:MAG: hypothetical protein O3A47_03810 [Chloroflexi bacterium]|nr:hypothetical protein [Chloroflexota bacterium]
MTETKTTEPVRAADVIERYGRCLELVPTDPSFHDISFGLYVKDGVCTVWTFSRRPGVRERVRQIRDRLVDLGGLAPIEGTTDQARFPCGYLHVRPVRFLMAQAVGKAKDYAQPGGDMSIKDSKTDLIISLSGGERDRRYFYEVMVEGEAANPAMRLRMVVAGFLRYGEMDKSGDTEVTFPCGQRHDQLMRLLLPYSRNVSAVEGMMEAEALRGQMTTNTLGFTPPS